MRSTRAASLSLIYRRCQAITNIAHTSKASNFDDTKEITVTQVLKVDDVRIAILKSMPPQWSIRADGLVATAGWTNPRLEPRFYINFPADGIQDLDFVADPPAGISNQVADSTSKCNVGMVRV